MKRMDVPRIGEHYYETTLGNGLRVRVVPKPGFARKYAFVGVNFGSADTAFTLRGQKRRVPDGIAHYLEHKLFDLPEGSADAMFAAAGAACNAFTSYDITCYYFSCVDRFEENLRTLLRMTSVPYFTRESVEKERGIIEQEIRMYEDSPDSCLFELLYAALYDSHPVRVPIAGSVGSIAEISAETLYDCFSAFYTPSNMMLCVVGSVEPEPIVALAEESFTAPAAPLAVCDYGEAEALDRAPRRVTKKMEVAMPMFAMGFRCPVPGDGRARMRQSVAAELACELLCGESSDLYRRLYEDGLIDSSFSSGFETVRGAGLVSVSGDTEEPDAVCDAVLAEAERLLREGFEPGAFERLKRAAIGSRLRELDSLSGICAHVCADCFDGAEYFELSSCYDAVTEEDAAAFLRDAIRPSRMARAIIEPL